MSRILISCLALAFSAQAALILGGTRRHPGNSLVIPATQGTGLVALSDTTWPGQAVLRSIDDNDRSLWSGRISPSARSNGSAFAIAAENRWSWFRATDVFPSRKAAEAATTPLASCFDGWSLFVEGRLDSLFYRAADSQIVSIARSKALPSILQVESTPAGAQVLVDGVYRGETPLELAFSGEHHALVRIQKEGYFVWEDVVALGNDKRLKLPIELQALPEFHDGTRVSSTGLTLQRTHDLHAVRKLLAKEQDAATRTTERLLSISLLQEWADTLRNRLYPVYLPASSLAIGEYDSVLGGLSVSTFIASNELDFGFSGIILCNPENAASLRHMLNEPNAITSATTKESKRPRRTSWPSGLQEDTIDGFLRLGVRNWVMTARHQSRDLRRFYVLESLELVLPDHVWYMKGTFEFPPYIRNTKEWKILSDSPLIDQSATNR